MKKKHVILIFSGYNSRALISFLRTLDLNEIDYLIVANGKDDFIYATKYQRNVILQRSSESLNYNLFVELSKKLKDDFESFIIAPSTEYLNQEILNQREELEKLSFVIPLVDKYLYSQISDKHSFTKVCRQHNLKVPNDSYNILDVSFPLVAKPIKYKSEITNEVHSPIIIQSKKERELFLKNKNKNDFFYQDYIAGQSFYLLFYFDKKGAVHKYSQKNLIQQPNGKSILLACSSDLYNKSIAHDYERMFIKEDFKGFVMVELKRESGEYYMIEANPRFWGPSQYFIDSGINLFENFLFDYELKDIEPSHQIKKAYYFWNDASLYNEEKSALNAFHDYSLKEFKVNLEDIKQFEIFKGRN